ncbi:hypothetical protein [Nesterenkonia muleiensis]|uniref:hypothetical protein n=1 Tax=Nesterenkonia muleiensis TaxID=2282648 RepID=UPI000E7501AD|nr:hypothetical protein [Nesterenkonia muleiensis]
MTHAPFDPWNSGTPAYRAALVTGMVSTFVGILAVIAAAFMDSGPVRIVGIVLIGAGVLSHLVGIGLRRRQAVRILRERKSE